MSYCVLLTKINRVAPNVLADKSYYAAWGYHRAIEGTEEGRGIKEKNIKSLDYDSKKD